eukprot:TRINITY_DN36423_c0_g1_i1.p1 TRINITY_DN36423_c0_g1~~TRINITY_DN36423_c0_g1_i1.p1  ORF type:complete len:393 (+),score=58.30 TRINITY_DN36423_c0_g1_i1:55-1233(+)
METDPLLPSILMTPGSSPTRGHRAPLCHTPRQDRGSDDDVASVVESIVASELMGDAHPLSTGRMIFGAAWMVLVVAIEVGISELVKFSDAPYLTTYINHGTTGIACFLCGVAILRYQGISPGQALLDVGFRSTRTALIIACGFSVLYKYNVFWAAAMSITSVGVFYAISQSYCVVVFALSVIWLGEAVTALKVVSVVLCVAGVIMISVAPDETKESNQTHVTGILLTLGFAVGQAVFTVLWGHFIPKAHVGTVLLFLGLMGLFSIVVCWPPIPVLETTGAEVVPDQSKLGIMALVALCAVANNFTLMFALSLTSPLFVSVGKVLQIPMGAASDRIFHGKTPHFLAAIGMVAVLFGFLTMTLERGGRGPRARPAAKCTQETSPDEAAVSETRE